jgi:hypothetical protein
VLQRSLQAGLCVDWYVHYENPLVLAELASKKRAVMDAARMERMSERIAAARRHRGAPSDLPQQGDSCATHGLTRMQTILSNNRHVT